MGRDVTPGGVTEYECLDCGTVCEAETYPGECEECGSLLRNRGTPVE